MWFKLFNKQTWELRMWRGINLRYNQDDFGMTRFKYNAFWKDFMFRVFRNDTSMRCLNLFASVGWIPVMAYLLGSEVDLEAQALAQKQELEEAAAIKQELFQNRFGANTQPMRSIEDMMKLVSNGEVISNTMDYIGYELAQENTQDMLAGLDGWMTEQDRGMLEAYRAQKSQH